MRALLTILVLIPLILVSEQESRAQEVIWDRYRGPNGQGIYNGPEIPVSWSQEDILWETDLPGAGHSSPVVWKNTVFVTSAVDSLFTGFLSAIDTESGSILWQKEILVDSLLMHRDNNLASATPAVDGSRIYSIWYGVEKIHLFAHSHTGSLLWRTEIEGIGARHGGGSSLALAGASLVFTREQEKGSKFESSWMAVDRASGEVSWTIDREQVESNSFSTPILLPSAGGSSQLLFASEAHGLTGVEPGSGQILWERKELLPHRVVASPVFSENVIIACRKGEAIVLGYDPEAGIAEEKIRYALPRNLSPYVPTPIAMDGLLYSFTDGGTIACTRLEDGELVWKERPAGPIYGSPVCANGNLYCMTKEGEVVVIRAGQTYQLHSVFPLNESSFSTPAFSADGMILRTLSRLRMLGNISPTTSLPVH